MSVFKSLFKGILGMDDSAEKAARAQAQRAEEELRKAQEAQKLQAANEMQSVTTIDTAEYAATGSDNRRKRRTAGAATSNLGLNV